MDNNISINVSLNIEAICNRTDTGVIKLFREDVEEIIKDSKHTYIGSGYATGKDKEKRAAHIAISNPIMTLQINEALKILIIFTVSPDNDFEDVESAVDMITESVHPDAKILFGLYFNEEIEDEIRVDVIATH